MAKFCPECGFKQHNDNNRYCSNCGFDFSKVESNIKSEESDNSSITVPITSDDEVVSKPAKSTDSKTIGSSSSVSSSDSGVISSSSSVSSSDSGLLLVQVLKVHPLQVQRLQKLIHPNHQITVFYLIYPSISAF